MKNYITAWPELKDTDREWLQLMLTAGELDAKVEVLCGCGFLNECGMHCNHERFPDLCPGQPYKPS